MDVQAKAKFIRISPKKARLVVGLIRNLAVAAAQEQLKLLPKKASADVLKVLKSAIANAKHNKKAKEENLIVSRAFVDEGPTLKRWRARAFGRAAQIRKRTSHITIVVSDKKETRNKIQTNSKSQITNNKQISNSNVQNSKGRLASKQ